ncbi:MAG: VWA domain-containing protein, partial [Bacteroidia bacterium]
MFRFENKEFFWAYLLIPVLVVFFVIVLKRRKKLLKHLGDFEIVKQMMPNVSKDKQIAKFILYIIAFCFLIFGIVNLQTGSKMQEVKREGGDIMVCLDVSNSMLAEDLSPNRLERAKHALEKFIDKLVKDNPYLYSAISNGNEGPGISTAGLPAASSNVFSSGAVLTKEVGNDLYGAVI